MQHKVNVVESGLLRGMLDIHSHILPGVDDGAKNMEFSREICEVYHKVGIERAFCTPHIMASMPNNNIEHLTNSFTTFAEKETGIEFRLAAEYMIDDRFAEATADGRMLSYDGKYVLTEVPRRGLFADIKGLLFGIIDKGYMPVLAHPERYIYYTPEDIRTIKESGMLFQLNMPSLSDYYGEVVGQRARDLFDQGLYDFVATDFHGPAQLQYIESLELDGKQFSVLEQLIENNNALWI